MIDRVGLDPGRVLAWPARSKPTDAPARVAVITVNHNTRLLIAQLIYSLYARVGNRQLGHVLVVDNASTDGSRELLQLMADAGLCELIVNDEQRYHGPALNAAIVRGASSKDTLRGRLRHVAYAGGWKKFEPLWDVAIRTGQVLHLLPFLEAILTGFGEQRPQLATAAMTRERSMGWGR